MDVEAPGRKRRSDAGTVRLSERDIFAFRWLSDMKAMYESDLRVLFGRISGRMPGQEAVRATIRRWDQAGYARAQKLLVGEPRIVWLLPPGATIVGETSWRETAAHTSIHQAEVAHVRLWMEGQDWPSGRVTGWQSERRLRQEAGFKSKSQGRPEHFADAIATFEDGTRAAVEVERSPKELSRVRAIVMDLIRTYSLTIYAVPEGADERERVRMDAIARVVRTAYEQVKEGHEKAGVTNVLPLAIRRYPAGLEA